MRCKLVSAGFSLLLPVVSVISWLCIKVVARGSCFIQTLVVTEGFKMDSGVIISPVAL